MHAGAGANCCYGGSARARPHGRGRPCQGRAAGGRGPECQAARTLQHLPQNGHRQDRALGVTPARRQHNVLARHRCRQSAAGRRAAPQASQLSCSSPARPRAGTRRCGSAAGAASASTRPLNAALRCCWQPGPPCTHQELSRRRQGRFGCRRAPRSSHRGRGGRRRNGKASGPAAGQAGVGSWMLLAVGPCDGPSTGSCGVGTQRAAPCAAHRCPTPPAPAARRLPALPNQQRSVCSSSLPGTHGAGQGPPCRLTRRVFVALGRVPWAHASSGDLIAHRPGAAASPAAAGAQPQLRPTVAGGGSQLWGVTRWLGAPQGEMDGMVRLRRLAESAGRWAGQSGGQHGVAAAHLMRVGKTGGPRFHATLQCS